MAAAEYYAEIGKVYLLPIEDWYNRGVVLDQFPR